MMKGDRLRGEEEATGAEETGESVVGRIEAVGRRWYTRVPSSKTLYGSLNPKQAE
jgi:hypothetical protein